MATVPIVTELTKAELDALVAENGLNEGLQYKVTDKNWLLTATSNNTYKFFSSAPFLKYTAFLEQSNSASDPVTPYVLENELGDIIWAPDPGYDYMVTGTLLNSFPYNKTCVYFYYPNASSSLFVADDGAPDNIKIGFGDGITQLGRVFIEIRVYQI